MAISNQTFSAGVDVQLVLGRLPSLMLVPSAPWDDLGATFAIHTIYFEVVWDESIDRGFKRMYFGMAALFYSISCAHFTSEIS
ncbi:uncharacterized protein PHALS_14851 [Plasmopara halstedii]|uniref:Uncharacterized protein n=1 Tax=Plasmopara halstedii TaxID=4781 RepID=A0A0P1AWS4_PLAHL|nr:uncharacterized protein PHALS_14851 [Plasmopara halstedii]CEG45941.1 hypothetical protein PHALS_14851 [Plasmopara halstedii]|eukprot:XP_024582310.1 hypothetical protein PHALS_14851 [Plasmopara halstedii]